MTTIEQVKERLDIADVVSQYVSLQKAGRNLRAHCPFHQERTPSFYVFPHTQTWRCFGACATGGDVIAFVQRAESLDFSGALRQLAQRAGVELPQRTAPSLHQRLYAANQEAAQFYHQRLLSTEGEGTRRYLEGRGISPDSTREFLLGYSPPGSLALKQHLIPLGFAEEELLTAGLLRGEPGKLHDLFRSRLMFPIRDAEGRVTGFGARELDGSSPKYLNTPQTPLFDKGSTLYGLDRAAGAIRRLGQGVVVEGYMDVIALHQHGFQNVVASMGTALTQGQLARLQRTSATFVLALDPDAAGQAATLQQMEEAVRSFQQARGPTAARSARSGDIYASPLQRFSLRVALLPPGKDPDQLVRQSPEEWERAVGNAAPLVEYLLQRLAEGYDLSTAEGKAQAAERLAPLVYSQVGNFLEQDRLFQRMADLLGVSRQVLEASLGRFAQDARRGPSPRPQRRAAVSPFVRSHSDPVEVYCLALLLHYPELKEVAQEVPEEWFTGAENREMFTRWMQCDTIEGVREALDPSLIEHLDELLTKEFPPLDVHQRKQALGDALGRLQERRLREAKHQEGQLLGQDTAAGEEGLEEQSLKTNEELRALFSQRQRRT